MRIVVEVCHGRGKVREKVGEKERKRERNLCSWVCFLGLWMKKRMISGFVRGFLDFIICIECVMRLGFG